MRIVRAIHDLSLALLVGGITGGALSAIILFREAQTREMAGAVGQAIFNLLGLVVLSLSVTLVASRALLQRLEPPSTARSAALVLSAACLVVAAGIALWITPAMDEIWRTAPHAQDGSGLEAGARHTFMRWHGVGNLCYLTLLLCSAVVIMLRPGPTLSR